MNPDFEGQYGANLVGKEARFDELLRANAIADDNWQGLRQQPADEHSPASTPISC